MTFTMENIKKVFRTYFFWVVVHAVLGLIFLIQALWVSTPIRYQSGAQEEFFIQRTSSSKQPCLTLSSSIRGDLTQLSGTLPSNDNLCTLLPNKIPIRLDHIEFVERWGADDIVVIKTADPLFYRTLNLKFNQTELKMGKVKLYLFFVFIFPFFWMMVGGLYRLFSFPK